MALNFEFLLEMLGIVAFAVFGTMAALENGMDIFGVLVIAVVTSVGGGLVRDLILNTLPPVMFSNPVYCAVSAVTALIIVLIANLMRMRRLRMHNWKGKRLWETRMRYLLTLCDAIGLGVFTILGAELAVDKGFRDNTFLVLFTAVLTGTGGGVMRDVLLCRQPLLFKREIYAMAALAGAVCYYYLSPHVPNVYAFYASALLIVVIRMVAVRRDINLPSILERKAGKGGDKGG